MGTTKHRKESLNKKKSFIRRMMDYIKGDSFTLTMFLLIVLTLSATFPSILKYSTERCEVDDVYYWKYEFLNLGFIIAIISVIFLFIMGIKFMIKLTEDEKENKTIAKLIKENLQKDKDIKDLQKENLTKDSTLKDLGKQKLELEIKKLKKKK